MKGVFWVKNMFFGGKRGYLGV